MEEQGGVAMPAQSRKGREVMAYLALYRQYRPRTFSEVVGQEHITRTLQNQVKHNHIAHAYLFCGSRGTGKTSTAKILARAINCKQPISGEPCGACEVCRLSEDELAVDILEIDAASNNGVDEIRDLREKVRYAPSIGRYKVYIIDEVHMLSQGAFNALLKTLEEPPPHAVFILATTETHRLPATIVSRCQRFDFHRIPEEVIVQRMRTVLASIGRQAQPEALSIIARDAEGGMRDALSILDQCLGMTEGELTQQDVLLTLGAAGGQTVQQLAAAVAAQDVQAALDAVQTVYENGADLGVFVRECMQHYRDLLIQNTHPGKTQSAMQALDILAAAEAQMRQSPRPRVLLDAAVVRLCMPRYEAQLEALHMRVAQLEQDLDALRANGVPVSPAAQLAVPPVEPQRREQGEQLSQVQDMPPWEEAPLPFDVPVEDTPPWEAERTTVAASPKSPTSPKSPKSASARREIPRAARPVSVAAAASANASVLDQLLMAMQKVNVGVSQSLRLARRAEETPTGLALYFQKGDEVFISALAQYQQDLDGCAGVIVGRPTQVHLQVEQDDPDRRRKELEEIARKTGQALGVPVEIEE